MEKLNDGTVIAGLLALKCRSEQSEAKEVSGKHFDLLFSFPFQQKEFMTRNVFIILG